MTNEHSRRFRDLQDERRIAQLEYEEQFGKIGFNNLEQRQLLNAARKLKSKAKKVETAR